MAHWMVESKGLKDGVLIQGHRTFGTSKVIKITYMHLLHSSLYKTTGKCTYIDNVHVPRYGHVPLHTCLVCFIHKIDNSEADMRLF